MTHAARISRDVVRSRRRPNLRRNPKHKACITPLPCIVCGRAGPSAPAHVRFRTDGGGGLKPSDRYLVPLCYSEPAIGREGCHDRQHRIGEVTFWAELGVDAHGKAEALYRESGDEQAMLRIVERTWAEIQARPATWRG